MWQTNESSVCVSVKERGRQKTKVTKTGLLAAVSQLKNEICESNWPTDLKTRQKLKSITFIKKC